MCIFHLYISLLACRRFVNRINQATQQIGIRSLKYTMPKIKDMAWTIIRSLQDITDACFNSEPGSQHQCWIEVTLDAMLVANAFPGIVKVNSPVDADDIASCLSHRFQ